MFVQLVNLYYCSPLALVRSNGLSKSSLAGLGTINYRKIVRLARVRVGVRVCMCECVSVCAV